MADFSALIAQIEAYVKQNGNNEITGNGLQSILVGMVNALGTVAITALQGDLADEVTARQNADGAINAKIPAEASSSNKLADKAFVTTLTDALQSAIDTINANIGNGYVYAGVATPSGTPVSGKVVYLTAQAGTYTNYGGLVVPTGISVLKYNGTTWSQEQVMSMADIYRNPLMGLFDCSTAGATAAKVVTADGYVLPTNGGSMKVRMANHTTVDNVTLNINGTGAKTLYYKGKAAGINNTWGDGAILNVMYDSTNSIYLAYDANAGTGDGVFDISDYTGDTYEDLEAALADVPVSERHGGMMVRFIQGSAPSVYNKYVQFRYLLEYENTTAGNNAFVNPDNWIGVDTICNVINRTNNILVVNGLSDGTTNDISYNNTRLTTCLFKVKQNLTITAASGFVFRVHTTGINGSHSVADWVNSTTLSDETKYYNIDIRKSDNSIISVSDFTTAITSSFSNCIFYISPAVYRYAIDNEMSKDDGVSGLNKIHSLLVLNGVIHSDGSIEYAYNRIATCLIKVPTSRTIVANTGYQFRVHAFDKQMNRIESESVVQWSTSGTISPNIYCIVDISKTDNSAVSVSDFSSAITLNLDSSEFYLYSELVFCGINHIPEMDVRIETMRRTQELVAVNGVMASDGSGISYMNTRIVTGLIYITKGSLVINAGSGYTFRVHDFDENLVHQAVSQFVDTYTITDNSHYYCFDIRKADNTDIFASELANALSFDTTGCRYYIYPILIAFMLEQADNNTRLLNVFNKTNSLPLINGITASSGNYTISTSGTRITTGIIQITSNTTVTAGSGYQFRVHSFNDMLKDSTIVSDWTTSFTLTDKNKLYVLDIRKSDNSAINVSDFTEAITSNFNGCILYNSPEILKLAITKIGSGAIEFIDGNRDEIAKVIDNFNLNRNLVGLNDMVWEYQNWVWPQVVSYNGVRNNLYFTFTNQAGFSGIAQYDYETQKVTKTFLKKNEHTDDHNLIAILMMSNGKLICSYSGGHNTDKNINIRIASAQESIENFDDVITLESSGLTSYSQLFEYDDKLYLFYRVDNTKWAYRISEDFGNTWSAEVILIQYTMQYYCQFTETLTDGVLRLCCYSNPEASDSAIREGYLHLDTMTLYSNDNQTVIGTSNIVPTSIPVIIPIPTGKVNRLFNAAKTAIGDTKVLYCQFTNSQGVSDGKYYVYDNGVSVEIADAGTALWIPKAQLGVAWIGTSQIVVGRGYLGNDVIEIYDYSNQTVTYNKTIVSNPRTDGTYRTARPMVDNHQKSIVYLQGYFDSTAYTSFCMDGKIYQLTN